MKIKKLWPIIVLILATLLSIMGAGLVATYILEAVIARRGEPDQSLLFWYLPFLFFGIIGLVSGLSMGVWSFKDLKKNRKKKNPLP